MGLIDITLAEIITLILFIVPGYLTIKSISIYHDFYGEKDTSEKVIQYLLFSSFSFVTFIRIFNIWSASDEGGSLFKASNARMFPVDKAINKRVTAIRFNFFETFLSSI